MEKNQMLKKYDGNRMMILFVVGLNVANCLSLLLSENGSFLISPVIPQFSLLLALSFFEKASLIKYAMIGLFTVLPTLCFVFAYFKSKTNHKWFLACTFAFSADIVIFVYYIFESGFGMDYLPDCAIELLIFYALAQGYIIGTKLKGNLKEEPQQLVTKKKDNETVFEYDEALAKQNKTDKVWIALLVFFGSLAAVYGLSYLLSLIVPADNQALGVTLSYGVIILVLVLYVVAALKLTPYTNAISYYFCLKKNVLYIRNKMNEKYEIKLKELNLLKETKSAYLCSYKDDKKAKKITIPKCYKGIESVFKK